MRIVRFVRTGVILAAGAVAIVYGGLQLKQSLGARTLDLCVVTDFAYREERPDAPAAINRVFSLVNQAFAPAGIVWRIKYGNEAYPPGTDGTMTDRFRRMEASAACKADVVLGLTVHGDRNGASVATPFSHMLLVADTAANPDAVTAGAVAHALAELFAVPVSPEKLLLNVEPGDGIFDQPTLALIRKVRNYDFAKGISALPGPWEQRAVDALSDALAGKQAHPDAEAHRIVGRAFLAARDYEHAVPHFQEAVRRDTNNADLRFEAGLALQADSRTDEALAELHAAAGLNQDNALPHAAMGSIYLNSGRLDQALEAFRTAVRLDPRNANYQAALGAALAEEPGHLRDAGAAFGAALSLKPSHSGALSGLLQEKNAERLYQAALRQSEAEVIQKPGSADAHLRAGVVYANAGNFPSAQKELRRAIELNPSDANAHIALARAYYLEARYAEADAEIKAGQARGATPPTALVDAIQRRLGGSAKN